MLGEKDNQSAYADGSQMHRQTDEDGGFSSPLTAESGVIDTLGRINGQQVPDSKAQWDGKQEPGECQCQHAEFRWLVNCAHPQQQKTDIKREHSELREILADCDLPERH